MLDAADLLARLPGPVTEHWPMGGAGTLRIGDAVAPFKAGSCCFVAAGVSHCFESFSADFTTWVVFWGPRGGEQPREGV